MNEFNLSNKFEYGHDPKGGPKAGWFERKTLKSFMEHV